jgi:hypothetical protein
MSATGVVTVTGSNVPQVPVGVERAGTVQEAVLDQGELWVPSPDKTLPEYVTPGTALVVTGGPVYH